jgi:D-threo-aldose 1-dehydrogenase
VPEPAGWLRELGRTGLTVSAITAGGAPLGSMPENFGYEVQEPDAVLLVEAILASPIRVIDTANGYSSGRSEERIGKAIAHCGGLPNDFLITTKVDARGADYSGTRVLQSVRESRQRLGIDTLELVYLHDPEFHDFDDLTAPNGAVQTLARLRDDGEVKHIGLAGGDVHEMERYLDTGLFEVLLVHNRWTLVDRSADQLISDARLAGVAVVNAAVYGGGILARDPGETTNYGYRPAAAETLQAIASMSRLCERFGIDLATAAMQWSLRDERIASTVIGFSKPERITSIMRAATTKLPEPFWSELEELVPARANWLDFQNDC